MADRDTLEEAKEAFKLATDAEADQRIMSLEDLRFGKLGEQWPDKVKADRELEGRPCLTHNRMPSFTKQVVNDARQNRPAMKFHPVGTGATRECAEIIDGLARNIEYTSNADVAYDTALDFSVNCGLGYWVVRTDYSGDDTFDLDIQIDRISNPFSVYGDPHSTGADSADWNTAFITDLLTRADFERRWPKSDTVDFAADSKSNKDLLWFQGDQIQVAEWWQRDEVAGTILKLSNDAVMDEDGYLKMKDILALDNITVTGTRVVKKHRVVQRLMSGCEVLETNAWSGKYIPIVPVYGEEVNIEGKRYFLSLIHFAKDSQRQYNYWKTTSTELVALAPKAPWVVADGQIEGHQGWNTANTVSHPYLKYTPVPDAPPPMRQVFTGPPAGAIQEALSASDDMKNIMGLHDASLGARSNETSGRAIMARQREGDVSTFNFIDNLSRGIRHSGRIIMDLIPHVYNTERIIRCIKEDGSNYSMPVNQPVMPQQAMQRPQQPPPGMAPSMAMPAPNPQMGPAGAAATPEMGQQQPQGQPMYHPAPPDAQHRDELKGLIKVFDLTAGKYDVTVEVGPGYNTRREEAAAQMMEFIRVFPQSAPLVGDLLAKNLDWPGADEIAKRLAAMLPPQIQGQNPQVAALQGQLKTLDGHAKEAVATLRKELADAQEKLDNKAMDNALKKYEAETNRIEALATALKDGVQLTTTAEGGMTAVPLVQPTLTPEQSAETALRHRDLALKERDLSMRERKSDAEATVLNTEALAQKTAQVDVPSHLMAMQQQHHEALMGALQQVARSVEQRPLRKIAKAVKDPATGAYILQSEEVPIEPTPMLADGAPLQ